jgi:hypothetical protein
MLGSPEASASWSGSHVPIVGGSRMSTTSTCPGQWPVREDLAEPCRSTEADSERSRGTYRRWYSCLAECKRLQACCMTRRIGKTKQDFHLFRLSSSKPPFDENQPMLKTKQRNRVSWHPAFQCGSSAKHSNLTKLPTLDLPQNLFFMHTHFHTNLIQAMFAVQKLDQLCSLLPRFFFFAFKLLL